MGEKITVSYLSFTLYIVFVIGASLLVGLLPVYVNPPQCSNNIAKTDVIRNVAEKEPSINVELKKRNRRSLTDSQLKRKEQIVKNQEIYLNEIKSRNPRFKSVVKSDLPYCSELSNPVSKSYPWYNYRLPTNVVPIHYDIYFVLPIWQIKPSIYDGYVDILINVTQPTDTIILHSDIQGLPIFQNVSYLIFLFCLLKKRINVYLL
jgi:hypothetical protein